MDNVMSTAEISAVSEKSVSFAKANIEAILQANRIWNEGLLVLSRSMAETTKVQMDDVLASWKTISSAASPKEALELQTSLARASFQKTMDSTTRLTEASLKLMQQTIAPLTARAAVVAETFSNAVKP